MENIIKYLPITTCILLFMYLCGGLYLISFWDTFNLDVSNLVGVMDILKCFIYPFIISNFFAFIGFMVGLLAPNSVRKKTNINSGSKAFKLSISMLLFSFIVTSIAGIILYRIFKYEDLFWFVACFGAAGVLIVKFGSSILANKYIPNHKIRYFTSVFIIAVPILCIYSAKRTSLSIYHNSDIKYITINKSATNVPINDSTSSKLLGFLGDKVIVSSLDNKKIFILNQSAFDVIEIEEKGKGK